MALCQQEGLFCSLDKLAADIPAVPGYHLGCAREDIVTIAMGEVCGCSGRGKATHLFWAEGNPDPILQLLQASRIGSGLSVITAAEADKAGADQINGGLRGHDGKNDVCTVCR